MSKEIKDIDNEILALSDDDLDNVSAGVTQGGFLDNFLKIIGKKDKEEV